MTKPPHLGVGGEDSVSLETAASGRLALTAQTQTGSSPRRAKITAQVFLRQVQVENLAEGS